jgi:hypothetical protein
MMCEDIALFQEIWEQKDEEQGEASLQDIRRYVWHREDIDMGWINMHWGMPQVLDASTSLPKKLHLPSIRWYIIKVLQQSRAS